MVNQLALEYSYSAHPYAGTVIINTTQKSHILALLPIHLRYMAPGIRTGVDSLAQH